MLRLHCRVCSVCGQGFQSLYHSRNCLTGVSSTMMPSTSKCTSISLALLSNTFKSSLDLRRMHHNLHLYDTCSPIVLYIPSSKPFCTRALTFWHSSNRHCALDVSNEMFPALTICNLKPQKLHNIRFFYTHYCWSYLITVWYNVFSCFVAQWRIVVNALAFGPRGPGFASRPCHYSTG